MKTEILRRLVFVFISMTLICAMCKKEDSPTESEEQQQIGSDWKTSESKTYTIPSQANSTVTDILSKFTFKFPNGGSGQLKVSLVTSGPNVITADSVFKIEYASNVQIQIVFKNNSSYYDDLSTYCMFDLMSTNESNEYGWIPISSKTIGTETLFTLPIKTIGKSSNTSYSGFEVFKNFKIPKKSTYDQLKPIMDQKVKDVLLNVKNVIPTSRRTKFISDYTTDLPPSIYLGMNKESWFKSFNVIEKYQPYEPITESSWLQIRRIILTDGSTSGNIAHETGHYIHHILVGNSKYSEFAANHRDKNHRIGTTGATSQLIEVPAYFTEYYINGKIGGSGSPESGMFVVNDGSGQNLSPSKTNMSDVEGMTVAMFASLIRTDATIKDFENKLVNVPIVSSNLTDRTQFFQEIYEIIAQGTDNIYSAREKLEAALDKYGQKEKMPAMLEPLGWSYFGQDTIVDANNNGIQGAIVKPISKVGNTTYYLPASAPSTNKGVFSLSRIFPGNSALRIIVGSDSIDISKSFDWKNPTNKAVPIGKIQFAKLSPLPVANVSLYTPDQSKNFIILESGDNVTTVNFTNKPPVGSVKQQVQWNGNSFTVSYDYIHDIGIFEPYPIQYKGKITGEIDPAARKIKLLDASVTRSSTADKNIVIQSLSLADVPLSISDKQIMNLTNMGDVKKYVKSVQVSMNGKAISTIDWSIAQLYITFSQ